MTQNTVDPFCHSPNTAFRRLQGNLIVESIILHVKTGKILYTIIMHILLNGASSLIVLATTGGSAKASIILLSSTAILIVVGVIAGVILFFAKRKKLQFDSNMPDAIPRYEVFRTIYPNPGVILFFACCIPCDCSGTSERRSCVMTAFFCRDRFSPGAGGYKLR